MRTSLAPRIGFHAPIAGGLQNALLKARQERKDKQTEMSGRKCAQCGLMNWAQASECGRCGATFVDLSRDAGAADAASGASHVFKRTLVVVAIVVVFLFMSYTSLHLTSDPLTFEQKQAVERAIDVLEQKGFGERAFVLRHLASYRGTDNWWNHWLGHHDAYAATNFPFEVVTLYPDFFKVPTDDVERAVVLLHESHHLAGDGEERAFTSVWREKRQLGWTKDIYGETRVWRNVTEFTKQYAPQLFRCGLEQQNDCVE